MEIYLPAGVDPGPVGLTDEWDPAEDLGTAMAFRARLKEVDSRLDLIWVKEGSTAFPDPGRWHIVRRNDDAPPSYWAIQGEDGEYCEPTDRHLEALRRSDTSAHPGLWRKWQRQKAARALALEAAEEEKHREFREKLTERLKFDLDTPRRSKARR